MKDGAKLIVGGINLQYSEFKEHRHKIPALLQPSRTIN